MLFLHVCSMNKRTLTGVALGHKMLDTHVYLCDIWVVTLGWLLNCKWCLPMLHWFKQMHQQVTHLNSWSGNERKNINVLFMYLSVGLVKVQKLHTLLGQTNHGFSILILKLGWWDHHRVLNTCNTCYSCGGTYFVPLYILVCHQIW